MTETITIECEWDQGELRSKEVFFNERIITWNQDRGSRINIDADILAKIVGCWKIEQDKRSVDPS